MNDLNQITNYLKEIKRICDENDYEYYCQVRPEKNRIIRYNSYLYTLDTSSFLTQKSLFEIKLNKERKL